MLRPLTHALVMTALLAGCGRYPDEARAYHTERFGPDRGPQPLLEATAKPAPLPEPPPPGGAELFARGKAPSVEDGGSDSGAPAVQPDAAPSPPR
jgi:hypothetical protein